MNLKESILPLFRTVLNLVRLRSGHRENQLAKAFAVGLPGRAIAIGIQIFGTSMLVSFLGGNEGYGIYATIISVVAWIQLGNFGFGLGLQNTLIEATAQDDLPRQKRLIATTQHSLLVICSVGFVVWTVCSLLGWIDWVSILNARGSSFEADIPMAAYVMGTFTLLSILLSYVSPIYAATQKMHQYGYWDIASQVAGFGGLLVSIFLKVSIVGVVFLCNGLPTVVILINAVRLMIKDPQMYFPHKEKFSRTDLRSIMNVGLMFTLIQISGVLQYSLDKLFISNAVGPAEVTPYTLAMRLFMAYGMITGIVFGPLWAAFGNAIASNDWEWIRRRKRQVKVLFIVPFLFFWLFIMFAGQFIVKIWIGPASVPGLSLLFIVGLYNLSRIWLDVHSLMCNAFNRIKENAFLGIPISILQACCMYYCAKRWGVFGMVAGNIFCMLITGGWILPMLVRSELRRRYARFVNSADNLQSV